MSSESTRFDAVVKFLCSQSPKEIVGFLCGWPDIERIESVGGEVSIARRSTDQVFCVTLPEAQESEDVLVHLEFQSDRDKQMSARLLGYAGGLIYNEKRRVMPVVWYVSEKRPSFWPQDRWYRITSENWQVDGIGASILWKEIWLPGAFQAHQFLAEAPPVLWPFAATMDGAQQKPFISKLHQAISNAPVGLSLRQDLLLVGALLLSRHHRFDTVKEIFNMIDLTDNPLINYFEDKGRQEGLCMALRFQAKKQFPRIRETTLSQLDDLNAEQLQALMEQMYEFTSSLEFRRAIARLKQAQPQTKAQEISGPE